MSETEAKKVHVTVIHSKVPIPVNRESYPFDELDVDQMFEFPIKKRGSVDSLVTRHNKLGDKQFTVRKIDATTGGVWRIA